MVLSFSIRVSLVISYVSLLRPVLSNPETDNYYYSANVTEATAKFVAACNFANGSIEYINHTYTGVYGEQLQATVCAVGNMKTRAVVYTISGTHGIEGYAGSMAQISMLRGNSSMYPKNVRMVHLHMVNPYGASYILKENEQNADQLKNEAMYYSLNYDNPILQRLLDEIDLSQLGNTSAQQHAYGVFAQLINEYGQEAVNLALKTGQGKRPQGLAYFGPSKSWSSQTESYVVDNYLLNATDILLIDWHTAVGPYGAWSFVPIDSTAEAAFKRWAPNDLMSPYDLGVPPGSQLQYTSVQTRTNAKRFIRCFWEAGTYNVSMDTNAMFLLRLYCRFYSNLTDPFCATIIGRTREYFYPQGSDWKVLTFNGINGVLPKVLSGFAAEISFGTKSTASGYAIVVGMIITIFQLCT